VPPLAIRPLLLTLLWAAPAAALPAWSLAAAALWTACALLFALHGPANAHPRCALAALPVLLAAIPPPTAEVACARAGPVSVAGRVAAVVRAPLTGRCTVTFATCADRREHLALHFARDVEVTPGDRIRVLARQSEPAVVGERGALHGIAATLRVTAGPWSLARVSAALRRSMERQLLRLLPDEHGAMLATLVLGRDTRPDSELAAAHRHTGLSHLLAVSGAHAAMLAFLLGMSSRGRHLGASRARTWFVLTLLALYGAIAGAEPPVLRAVVAYTLAACAARRGRPFSMATGLVAPALVTCLVQPRELLGPSFLLSYAAVTGLWLALPQRPPDTWLSWLREALRASLWATLLTAPLTLHYFGQLAPGTIVLTPLCAPIVAALLLLGLIAAAVGCVAPPFADLLAWPLRALCELYSSIVLAADALPATPIPASFAPPWWALLLVSLAGCGWILWRPHRRRVACTACAVVALWFVPSGQPREAGFVLFAVGHGQTALLTTENGAQVVVDCGSLQGPMRAVRGLRDHLRRRHVDLLVVTHADCDHHNGVPLLLGSVPIARALLAPPLQGSELHAALSAAGIPTTIAPAGERLRPLPGVEVFAPAMPPDAVDNDRSLWVRARTATTSVLLTGDAEERGVTHALQSGFARPSDVVVLPHHGRPNDRCAALLARVRPLACLASANAADGETALGATARRFGADLWVTGLHGDLVLAGPPVHVRGGHGVRPLRTSERPNDARRTGSPDRGRAR